jgi:hypothetical protein
MKAAQVFAASNLLVFAIADFTLQSPINTASLVSRETI